MTDIQKLHNALGCLNEVDATVQSVFSGTDASYRLYEMVNELILAICEEAAEKGIDMDPESV